MLDIYPGIEDLHGKMEHEPIKAFFVTRAYAYSAIVSSVMDGNDIREAIQNDLDGPNSNGAYISQNGRRFANDVAQGFTSVILDEGVEFKGHEIVLVDIVTYPLWHCLISGLHPFSDGNANVLWKVNHNILAPYLKAVRSCGYAYSIFHFNEDPIDDAPTHNIIAFHRRSSPHARNLCEAVLSLANQIPNVSIVSDDSPFMDDRYCLNSRLPTDPPCPQLPKFQRTDLLIPA